MLKDWKSALEYNMILLNSYKILLPETHPLIGLQLYSIGKLSLQIIDDDIKCIEENNDNDDDVNNELEKRIEYFRRALKVPEISFENELARRKRINDDDINIY